MFKLQSHKASNIRFNIFEPPKKEVGTLWQSHKDKQAHKQTEEGKQKREEEEGKRKREEIGKERANKTARVKWGRGKREANDK